LQNQDQSNDYFVMHLNPVQRNVQKRKAGTRQRGSCCCWPTQWTKSPKTEEQLPTIWKENQCQDCWTLLFKQKLHPIRKTTYILCKVQH